MPLRFTDLEDFKSYVGVKSPDKAAQLERTLAGAETFAETYTRRRFAPLPVLAAGGADTNPPVAKAFPLRYGESSVRVPDLRAVESVELDGIVLSVVGGLGVPAYSLEGTWPDRPATHLDLTSAYAVSYRVGQLEVTGRWGWNPIPDDLIDAVYTHASRRWREKDANYADTVQNAAGETFAYFRLLPSNVKAVYDGYKVTEFEWVTAGASA